MKNKLEIYLDSQHKAGKSNWIKLENTYLVQLQEIDYLHTEVYDELKSFLHAGENWYEEPMRCVDRTKDIWMIVKYKEIDNEE